MFIKVNCLHKGYNHHHQPAVSVIIHRDIWHNPILYFQIAHNTLCFPPKFCISYGLQMLLGKCRILRNIWKQMFMQNLGGQTECIMGDSKKAWLHPITLSQKFKITEILTLISHNKDHFKSVPTILSKVVYQCLLILIISITYVDALP